MSQTTKIIRTLPWGEEIYTEIPLHKKSANKFYARHGKTRDGREYKTATVLPIWVSRSPNPTNSPPTKRTPSKPRLVCGVPATRLLINTAATPTTPQARL